MTRQTQSPCCRGVFDPRRVVIWHLMADSTSRFHDLGADYHTARVNTERRIRNHIA